MKLKILLLFLLSAASVSAQDWNGFAQGAAGAPGGGTPATPPFYIDTTAESLYVYNGTTGYFGVGGSGGDSWGDAVDAVITPDADGTRDFGLTGTRFATGFFDDLDVTTDIVVGGTVDGIDVSDLSTSVDLHFADNTNPHGTDAVQVGAVPWNDATSDPDGDDDSDNFSEGTIWRNNQGTSDESDDTLFQLLDDSDGAAVWVPLVRLTAAGALSVSSLEATTLSAGTFEFEGATEDEFETSLVPTDPTADRTITLPDATGTVALTSDIPAEIETFILTIDDVADSMDYAIGFVSAAFTITEIRAVHAGTGLSTPDIDIDVRHSTDRSASGNQVDTTAITITSSTTGDSATSGFEDATVPANSWIWVETASQSGTTDNLEIVVRGTYD